MKGNKYSGTIGGAIYAQTSSYGNLILIDQCTFSNVSSPGSGAALYVDDSKGIYNSDHQTNITIINSTFVSVVADDSSVYIQGISDNTQIYLQSSKFSNNIGSCLQLSACFLYIFCSLTIQPTMEGHCTLVGT